MWPFSRRERSAEVQREAGPVHRPPRHEWKGLAPIPTVQSRPLATVDAQFEQRLATRRAPTFLAPLGHHLAPAAPHGRVAAAPAPRQPVTFPPAPHVQRQVMTYAATSAAPSAVGEPAVDDGAVDEGAVEPVVPTVVPADLVPPPARDTTRAGGPGATRAPVTASVEAPPLVSAATATGLPATPFPVVARVAQDAPGSEDPADERPDTDDPVAALVGEKPPITSVPEPQRPLPECEAPVRGSGSPSSSGAAAVSRAVPRQPPSTPPPSAPAAAKARRSAHPTTTASTAATQASSPTAARIVAQAERVDAPTPIRPRIGAPIQRTTDDVESVTAAAAEGPPSEPASVPLVGERGWHEPLTLGSMAGPAPATRPRAPSIGAPVPGPLSAPTAQRTVTWRPRVGEPSAPSTSTAPTGHLAAPHPPAPRPVTVSRHAGTHSDEHAVGPVGSPSTRLLASTSVATAPRSDARTGSTHETIAGIRWSDRPVTATAQRWTATAAAVQRATSTGPRTSLGAPTARPAARTFASPPNSARLASAGGEISLGSPDVWPDLPGRFLAVPVPEPVPAVADLAFVQRQADAPAESPAEPAPAPTTPTTPTTPTASTTMTATAEAGPAAVSPAGGGAAGGTAKAPTEAEVDEWARALYPSLRRRLCRDLLLDRERAGYSTDIRF